jgi:predicted acetyltransferase
MTAASFNDIPVHPPPELLTDGVIELRVIRVLGPQNVVARPAAEMFLSRVPEYRFAIHRRTNGLRVGRIHIRVTTDERIVATIGHTGYEVDEAHRRCGYATRAVTLVVGLAKYWNVLPIWIFIEPENMASRRTVERAGLQLVDIVDSPPEIVKLGMGNKVCRYRSVT